MFRLCCYCSRISCLNEAFHGIRIGFGLLWRLLTFLLCLQLNYVKYRNVCVHSSREAASSLISDCKCFKRLKVIDVCNGAGLMLVVGSVWERFEGSCK